MPTPDERSPYEIIEEAKVAYREGLPEADPNWHIMVYDKLQNRLFELGLEAKDVVEECGIGDNNIYTRFSYFRNGLCRGAPEKLDW